MNLQSIGQSFVSGIQSLAQSITAKLGDFSVAATQLISKVKDALREYFPSLQTPLTARQVEVPTMTSEPRQDRLGLEVDSKEKAVSGTVDQVANQPSLSRTMQDRLEKMLSSSSSNVDAKTLPQMVSGEKAIKDSGLVKSHVEQFIQVAKDSNTILMFRPVNPMSTGLLEDGTSAKGLNVHGKSSDWGPMAGYIPKDQNLCKKHGDPTAIQKGISDNNHSLHEDKERVSALPLELTSSRFNYLLEKNLIQPSNEKGEPISESPSDGPRFFINGGGLSETSKSGNNNYVFKFDPTSEGSFKVAFMSRGEQKPVVGGPISDWQPLEVMGDAKISKALTADYDVFAMLPKLGDGSLVGKSVQEERLQVLRSRRDELKQEIGTTGGTEAQTMQLKALNRAIVREAITSASFNRLNDRVLKLENEIGELTKSGGDISDKCKELSTLREKLLGQTIDRARDLLLGQTDRREVDGNLGRLTSWQRDMRNRLNEAGKQAGFTGGDLVKHGTEQDNTQFPEVDQQIFIITPDGQTFMTQNWEQTQAFMWTAKQDDFLTYQNRAYLPNENATSQTKFYPEQTDVTSSKARILFNLDQAAETYGFK